MCCGLRVYWVRSRLWGSVRNRTRGTSAAGAQADATRSCVLLRRQPAVLLHTRSVRAVLAVKVEGPFLLMSPPLPEGVV